MIQPRRYVLVTTGSYRADWLTLGEPFQLDAATALKDHANKTVKLGRPPGPKVRSVMAPAAAASLKPSAVANLKQPPAKASSGLTEAEGDVMIDLDDF